MNAGAWALIASDVQRWRDDEGVQRGLKLRWFFDPGFCASLLLRLATGCHARGWLRLSHLLSAVDYLYFKIQFDPATVIGPRLMLRRPMGVIIFGAPIIGGDVTLCELVTIGEYAERRPETPTVLGDNVTMEPGSCVLAGCTVGAGRVISANSVVTVDLPALEPTTAAASVNERLRADPDVTRPEAAERRLGLAETATLIRSDLRRRATDKRMGLARVVLEVPLTPPMVAVIAYRVSHYCWHNHMRWAAHLIRFNSAVLLGSDIHPAARIGAGVLVSHPAGVVVGRGSRIGDQVFLCPHSSVDRRPAVVEADAAYPVIGARSFVGHQAHVLGRSSIGDRCLIGGAVVVTDAAFGDNSLVYGRPSRHKPLDGRFDDPLMLVPEPDRPSPAELLSAAETRTWQQTRALIRSDRLAWRRPHDSAVEPTPTPGMRTFARTAQLLVRLQNHLHVRGHVLLARVLFLLNLALFGIEVPQGTPIGPGLRLTGWFGTCMRNDVVIGSDVTLGAKAGIGDNIGKLGMPVLHSGVTLRANVGIHGPVDVGEGTIVGPNSLLMRSVPAHSYVYGIGEHHPLT